MDLPQIPDRTDLPAEAELLREEESPMTLPTDPAKPEESPVLRHLRNDLSKLPKNGKRFGQKMQDSIV